ncbi:repressor of silencing, partial [Trifolium pratense]
MAIPFNDSSPVSENDDDTMSCCNEDLSNHADQVFDVLHQCEDVELCPPSFSKKRNNSQKDVNDELQKPVKRTKYRPKVVSQVAKRTKKSQPESNNTPKPATPKQRKTYVRRKTPKCQRPLFVDEDSISFSFLENFNNSKVDQHEIENSTITNESAIGYNSLQSYQKMTSLSCLTLIESRRVG